MSHDAILSAVSPQSTWFVTDVKSTDAAQQGPPPSPSTVTAEHVLSMALTSGELATALGVQPDPSNFSTSSVIEELTRLRQRLNVSPLTAAALSTKRFLEFLAWQRLQQLTAAIDAKETHKEELVQQNKRRRVEVDACDGTGVNPSCGLQSEVDEAGRPSVAASVAALEERSELYRSLSLLVGQSWRHRSTKATQSDMYYEGVSTLLPYADPAKLEGGKSTIAATAPSYGYALISPGADSPAVRLDVAYPRMDFGVGGQTAANYYCLAAAAVDGACSLRFSLVTVLSSSEDPQQAPKSDETAAPPVKARMYLLNYSRNGVKVRRDEWCLERCAEVHDGDPLEAGGVSLIVHIGPSPRPADTPPAGPN